MKKLLIGLFISSLVLLSGCVAPTTYRVVPVTPPQQVIVIREYPTYYYPYPIVGWRFDIGWRSGHHHHRR